MSDQLRRRAVEGIGNALDLHRVVGYQLMAALQKLDGRLAFADAAVAQNQHALTVNVHQHAVAGDLRGQRIIEIVNDMTGGVHRITAGAQQGTAMLLGHLQQLVEHLQIPGDDHSGKAVAHQAVEDPCPLLGGHAGEKAHLALSQYQQPLGVKIIIKSHQLQGRTEHVRHRDNAGIVISAFAEDLHVEVFSQLLDAGGGASYFFHGALLRKYIRSIIPYPPAFRNFPP